MLYRNESIAVFASTKDAVKRAWTTLYGTAPKDNKIMEVAEGTALYLTNDEILTERFMPDDYYYNRPRVVSSGYTGHDPNQSWSNGQYGGYYTVNNQKAWSDGWDDPEDEDNFPPITFVGTNGDILCQHGCVDHDCEICNPDDELGSFLPVKYTGDNSPLISDGPGKWVSADQCELCDLWFSEKELTKVNDWGDNWKFCMTCLEEILEIEKEPSSYPMRIHGETIDEDAAITWLTDHHHDYIV
jgi:hypothetical protein